MHQFHHEVVHDLEHARLTRETEAYFQSLRDAGIEPRESRKPTLSWLGRPRRTSRLRPQSP